MSVSYIETGGQISYNHNIIVSVSRIYISRLHEFTKTTISYYDLWGKACSAERTWIFLISDYASQPAFHWI